MKHFFFAITTALALITGFSSCDDDRDRSIVLSGEWEGDFFAYYEYCFDEMPDKWFRAYADESVLVFTPNHYRASHGYGYEVDFYTSACAHNNAPYERFVNQFEWGIEDGHIYLTFKDDHNLDVYITRYELDNEVFSGRFESGNPFCLYKVEDYYDYSTLGDGDYFYSGTHGYGRDNGDIHYAPSSRSDVDESVIMKVKVRQGREFNLPDSLQNDAITE